MFNRLARITRRLWRGGPAALRALYCGWINPPTFPRTIHIEHTARCNLKCVMCIHGTVGRENVPDMSMETFTSIIDQFKGPRASAGFGGLECVILQGIGEPMLHPKVIPMLRFAHEKGLVTVVISNMTVMTEPMTEELVRLPLDLLIISIDAIDPDVFADIRRGAHFDLLPRVVGNIERVQQTKGRLGSAKPQIRVASLLMKRTLHQVPELVNRLKALGVSVIQFADVVTTGIPPDLRFSDGSRCADQTLIGLPQEERMRMMSNIKALDSPECRIEVPEDWGGASQVLRQNAVLTCDDLWDKPYVTVEGIVTPCCFAPYKEQLPMGDLRKQTFEEIWFGEAYQQLRLAHLTTRVPPLCYACAQRVKLVARNPLLRSVAGAGVGPRSKVFLGDRPFSLRVHRFARSR